MCSKAGLEIWPGHKTHLLLHSLPRSMQMLILKQFPEIILIDGYPALAGSFTAKLNETGRRLLKRRVNRVGDTLVYRRNKVLDDLVSIERGQSIETSG